jgi:hypothetical protein
MLSISPEILAAIIAVTGVITAGLIAFFQSRSMVRKSDVEALQLIIDELTDRIDRQDGRIQELEELNEDFESWATSLCNQIRELGMVPVKFVRRRHQPPASTDRKTRPFKRDP